MFRYLAEMFAGIAVISLSVFRKRGVPFADRIKFPENLKSRNREKTGGVYWLSLCCLIVAFAFLLFYKIEQIPAAFNVDEAGSTYDALSIINYGVDRYLYKNPVYFINFGSGQNALYTYLIVLSVKLFGYSILSVRLPVVILSLAAALCFTFLIREEYGNGASLISLSLFCVLPFSIMHSRWGLESYLLFPLLIISSVIFYRAVTSQNTAVFFISGILFGLTLYTYAISYFFLVLFFVCFLPYLFYLKKIHWPQLFALGIPLFILALPLILMLLINNGFMEEIRTPWFSIPKLPEYRGAEFGFRHIFSKLQLNKSNFLYKLFFYDGNIFNAIPKYGTLYYFSLPFIFCGFLLCLRSGIMSVRRKELSPEVMIFMLFFSALVNTLMIADVNINRANEIYYPLIFFLFLGIFTLLGNNRTAFSLTGCIYLLLTASFIRYYFTGYELEIDKNYGFSSINDLKEAISFAESIERKDKKIIIVGKSEPHINTLIAIGADPYSFAENKRMDGMTVSGYGHFDFMKRLWWENVPNDPIYIFRDIYNIPWIMDMGYFEMEQFGTMRVYYDRDYQKASPHP